MATTILIVCPECGKKIKAPDNVIGKRVRCKFCQAAFVASKGPGKPPAGKPAKLPAGKPAKPAKPAVDEDEDDDSNPYAPTEISLAPRCPDCANEMEEGQIVCLICGYNTRTRIKAKTRKVYDLTGGEHFMWLLPGIACALTVLGLLGFDIWYLLKIDDLINKENDSWYVAMWAVGGIKLWIIIMSLFFIWLAGKFAVKRLILHPKPPEVEKLK
jgi:hypothetical protein